MEGGQEILEKQRGRFVVFEGLDGSGKSTQVTRLVARLHKEGVLTYETREPTDGPVGSLIHQIMTGRTACDHTTLASLFVADRLDHLLNKINGLVEKVESGISVVCDRYYFSSYAYHAVHLPLDWLIEANSLSASLLRPDIVIFLDLPPEKCVERLKQTRWHLELYESLDDMHKVGGKYGEAFMRLQSEETIVVINANRKMELIIDDVWEAVKGLFIV